MKKLILIFLMLTLAVKTYPQCLNADFSDGSFQYWQASTGENSGGIYTNEVFGLVQGTTNSLPTDPGRQTIINQGYFDPNTNNLLWSLPPGGSSCARLGNENTNYEAERLLYVINVNNSNCIFTYQYAVVLEDPAHPTTDQPKFNIYVLDANNNVIDPNCGVYEVTSQSGIQGFQDATHAADGEVTHWKDWTAVGIDLTPYIGQTIHILFETFDCAQGAHFGYAYIACHCGALNLLALCTGTSAILTAPGGFSSYSWSTGGTGQTETITNPVNGTTVTCVCTSVQGCNMTLSIVLNVQPVVFTVNSATICSGTPTTLTATGTGYTYAWSNGAVGQSITVAPTTTTTYTVTATASGGCSNTAQSLVTVTPGPVGTTTSTPSACAVADGTITVNLTSGTAPYQYVWSTVPIQYTPTASNLFAGTYTVTVTDATGCTSAISGTVSASGSLNLTTSTTDENCGQANGTATVNANGGVGNFTYTWSTTPSQTTQTAVNLPAGTYTVTVASVGCSATAQVTIVNIPGFSTNISNIINTFCGNASGSATVTVTGGVPSYAYQWNSSPPQYTDMLQNVVAGTYTVTITDAVGCIATNSATITDTPGPTTSIISTDEMCGQADGTATVTAAGGSGSYTYLWSNGQTGSTATGLAHGNYSVSVSDANCITVGFVNVGEVPGPNADFSVYPRLLTLLDGPVYLNDNSSYGVVNWVWDYGDGTGGSGEHTYHQYMNIGSYLITLIITDGNGCTDTLTDSVKIKDIFTFYIPNVFTPNGNGVNDFFTPRGINVDPDNYDEYIFDRWGNLMFHTSTWRTTEAEGWNGTKHNKGTAKDVVSDVYVYKIILYDIDCYKHEYTGNVTIIQ